MKICRTIDDLDLDRSLTIGFVPTMGSFHEGHLSLMRVAKRRCDLVVVSLFVNPTQFAPSEDFSKYPRDENRDFDLASGVGVDVMFAPSVDEIYPRKTTSIHVAGVSDNWEGSIRPGHFDGVATVVLKLFNIVRPSIAFFGLKDLQQCAVISRMVEDLNVPVQLSFEATVREPDGLAMSSRNAYLSASERATAPKLHDTLMLLARGLREDWSCHANHLAMAKDRLSSFGFDVQYLEVVNAETLVTAEVFESTNRIIVAAKLGSTRLIDNIGVLD